MKTVIDLFNEYNIYIVGALIVIVFILFIMFIVSIKAINRLENRQRKLTRGVDNNNLEELINSYMDKIDMARKETEDIGEKYNVIDERINNCLQNVSIIRYKAFDDVGSDLSFSLAFLDSNKDGVIITSIYGRNESTMYAKPIDKGISRYDLSDEEKQVLSDAVNKSNK